MLQNSGGLNKALVQSIAGSTATVEKLLMQGASPNALYLYDIEEEGFILHIPLKMAYQKGNITVFELLLKYGADPDFRERNNLPVLYDMIARIGGTTLPEGDLQIRFVESLFKYGAVDFKEDGTTSPLSSVIAYKLQLLIPTLFGARLFLYWQTLPVEERSIIYSELKKLSETAPDNIPSLVNSDELKNSKGALREVYKAYPGLICTLAATPDLLSRAFRLMPAPSHFDVFPGCVNYNEVRMNLKGTLRFLGNMSLVCKAFCIKICYHGTFYFPLGDSVLPKEMGTVIMTTACHMACCPINFGIIFSSLGSMEKKVDMALSMIEKAYSKKQSCKTTSIML